MKNIIVFDNNGETFDRFTIIDKTTGEMIGASSNPFHPQGFGQHCGNILLSKPQSTIKERINEFKKYGSLGKVIDFATLPGDVQQFAKQSFE